MDNYKLSNLFILMLFNSVIFVIIFLSAYYHCDKLLNQSYMSSQTNLEHQRIQHRSCMDECRERMELLELTCQKSIKTHEEIYQQNAAKSSVLHSCDQQCSIHVELLMQCNDSLATFMKQRRKLLLSVRYREKAFVNLIASLKLAVSHLKAQLKSGSFEFAAKICATVVLVAACIYSVSTNQRCSKLTKSNRALRDEAQMLMTKDEEILEQQAQTQLQLRERNTKICDLEKQQEILCAEARIQQERLKDLQQNVDKISELNDKQVQQRMEKFQEKETTMELQHRDTRESLTKEIVESHKLVMRQEHEIKRLQQKMSQVELDEVMVSNLLTRNEREKSDLKKRLASTKKSKMDAENEYKHSITHLQDTITFKDTEVTSLQKQSEEKETEIKALKKHIDYWERENKKKGKEITELKRKTSDLSKRIHQHHEKVQESENELRKSKETCLSLKLEIQHSREELKIQIEESGTTQREADMLRRILYQDQSDDSKTFKLRKKPKPVEKKTLDMQQIEQELTKHQQITHTKLEDIRKELQAKYDALRSEYQKAITDTRKEASIMRMERENYMHSMRHDRKSLSMALMLQDRVSFSLSLSPPQI